MLGKSLPLLHWSVGVELTWRVKELLTPVGVELKVRVKELLTPVGPSI
jgi:hypothetical protein